MNFDETIRLRALQEKQLMTTGSSGLNDHLADAVAPEGLKSGVLKNICATVHVDLFNRVDAFTKQFGISKRTFVEMSLIESLRRAGEIVKEVMPEEYEEVMHRFSIEEKA